MDSVLPIPCGTLKYAFREHRLVVLPDYQGLGIGTKLSDFVAQLYINNGNKFFGRTTHIKLGNYRNKSTKWKQTATNQVLRKNINQINEKSNGLKQHYDDKRIAYSHEYVGEQYNKSKQYIICNGDCDYNDVKLKLENIIDKNKFSIIVTGVANKQTINNWEKYCKDNGIRTEILFIKKNDELNINMSIFNNKINDYIILDNSYMCNELKKICEEQITKKIR